MTLGAWFNVSGCDADVFEPAPQNISKELLGVIAPEERWRWVEASERFQHRNHILSLETSAHTDRKAQTAVLVDHIQKFQPRAFGTRVELEDHRPHLMRVFDLVTPNGAVDGPGSLLPASREPLETHLPPAPATSLLVIIQTSRHSTR